MVNRKLQKISYTITYVINHFMWHSFSYGYDPSIVGPEAMKLYRQQKAEGYYVFSEGCRKGYECFSNDYPDLSDLWEDFYIVPKSWAWTMVFTHEQDSTNADADWYSACGPYFAISGETY